MKIAYLINQYPHISHSFIRREIAAMENAGVQVERFSVRGSAEELVDQRDVAEQALTHVVLTSGIGRLLCGLVSGLCQRPARMLRALVVAVRTGWRSDRGVSRHVVYWVEAATIAKWMDQKNVKHLHAHFGTNSATVAMLCGMIGGSAYSFTVHGPEEFDRPHTLGLTEKIRHAAFVVGVSEFGRSQLYRWCPCEQWAKIHVVRCGVDDSFFTNNPSPVPDRPRLVCVGRLCEQKGQLLLVEAAGRLAAEGVEFDLMLVGDGPMRGQIERKIRQLKLEECVRITGWASGEQVHQEISAARAMVLPSFAEGLPVVIMEALALGRPVISTYVAGIPELVEPGINGWLVPAGNVEALAMAMKEALAMSVKQLSEMGLAGAQRVRQRHDAQIEANNLGELFRRHATRGAAPMPTERSVPQIADKLVTVHK